MSGTPYLYDLRKEIETDFSMQQSGKCVMVWGGIRLQEVDFFLFDKIS